MKLLEGSEVMEKLAAVGLVDEFLEAVDTDDMIGIVSILKEAEIDDETIRSVLEQIS